MYWTHVTIQKNHIHQWPWVQNEAQYKNGYKRDGNILDRDINNTHWLKGSLACDTHAICYYDFIVLDEIESGCIL